MEELDNKETVAPSIGDFEISSITCPLMKWTNSFWALTSTVVIGIANKKSKTTLIVK